LMQKNGTKILLIFFIGLLAVVFLYPLVHELGHVLASLFVRAEVCQITVLPIPSVLTNTSDISNDALALIGFSGMILPMLIACAMPRRWFVSWYIRILLKGISGLSILISIVSIVFGINSQDDMMQVMRFWEYDKNVLLAILCTYFTLVSLSLFSDRPWQRICSYLGI